MFGRACLASIVVLTLCAAMPVHAHASGFTGPTNFDASGFPWSIATDDFNADADPDLAVANGTATILLGAAGGSFGTPVGFPVGDNPLGVATGDFNGDADPDLAVANDRSENVSILLGAAGGTFTGSTNIPIGAKPRAIVVADFNDDSNDDVAVTPAAGGVGILLGDGTGGFTGPTGFPAGGFSLAVGDFNGDSDPDLAVTSSGGVSILLGDGSGSFTGPTTFPTGFSPWFVAVGEFNGDSDPDLALSNLISGSVSILLGAAGGTFTGPTSFAAGPAPTGIAVGDLDGDSNPDLAVANHTVAGSVSILLGAGGGSFGGPIGFPAGTRPASIAESDFNGDSRLDLAVANSGSGNVSVLLGMDLPTISVDDVSKLEGQSGQSALTFTVSLSGGSFDPVSVDYRTEDGTATVADSDYTALPTQTLTFAPGKRSKTVTVQVTGDTAYEPNESFELVLSNPTNASLGKAVGTGTILNDDGYPRPMGATPLRASLVVAYGECTDPDTTHGPPLDHPSCSDPTPLSQHLTVGTPDANGRPAKAVGVVRYSVVRGDPATTEDEADVVLLVSVTDVREAQSLDDYTAELWATSTVRLTDRAPVESAIPETVTDFEFGWAIPCAGTTDTTVGSTCALGTTADALLPGSVPERSRAIWELGQVRVQDGGGDGAGATLGDNTLFLTQGIFVP